MRAPSGTLVDGPKFEELSGQFFSKWKGEEAPPTIAAIWRVHDDQLLEKHQAYCSRIGDVGAKPPGRDPGNQQRRFHGTKQACSFRGQPCSAEGCSACSIIRKGFQLRHTQSCYYGQGIYSTSTSSKAYQYGQRAMLVVGVAAGLLEKVQGNAACKGPLQPGCHSRMVDKFNDELVVFEEAAIVPLYLIVFA